MAIGPDDCGRHGGRRVRPVLHRAARIYGRDVVGRPQPARRRPFRDLLLDSRQRGLLLNTAVLGIGTALTATLVGVPLGVALARVAVPFKAGARILLAAPALLPSYVVGLAWLSVSQATWMHSLPAAIVVLTVVLYPLSMLMTEAAVRGIEPRLEEAASLTAAPGRVLWRITLPLVFPSILAAALVVFVLAVSDFGVPALLRVRGLYDRDLHRIRRAVRLGPRDGARRAPASAHAVRRPGLRQAGRGWFRCDPTRSGGRRTAHVRSVAPGHPPER